MSLRDIRLVVGSNQFSTAIVWGYPAHNEELYVVPTYDLYVSGKYDDGTLASTKFEVLRFAVNHEKNAEPYVVGLKNQQTYTIKGWGKYKMHSTDQGENGKWIVMGSYYIHDGPDDPRDASEGVFGSNGCIEICGLHGFWKFNSLLIDLSGAMAEGREAKLKEIGRGRRMKIIYMETVRPPLVRL